MRADAKRSLSSSIFRLRPSFKWARRPLLLTARAVLRRPRLRALAVAVLKRAPRLHTQLRKAMRGPDWKAPRRAHMPCSVDDLSPATQAAYRALKAQFGPRES